MQGLKTLFMLVDRLEDGERITGLRRMQHLREDNVSHSVADVTLLR